jgi:GT2 family glycosyltransferase/SAM-dependent methyltransferase
MDIEYSDGAAIEGQILRLLRQSDKRGSGEAIAESRYGSWPVRYHLCPERSNLFRPFNFQGLDVLELGAGMGAVSRLIAEKAASLYVVEGTQARFEVLSERLSDLTNWAGEVGNFESFQTDRRFDVVALIGVLEYSELFIKRGGKEPHLWLLKHCKQFLKPGGVLVVAIENALGLKYWNGSAEDHRATLFDGVVGYPDSPTPRTFSRKALTELVEKADFPQIDTFYPFPDYKVPTTIVSAPLFEKAPELSAELATVEPYGDYLGFQPVKYFSDTLAAHNLSQAGLLADFSNSFLFVASSSEGSPTRKHFLTRSLQENELAWHYGHARRDPTQTIFFQDLRSESILVQKTGLYSSQSKRTYAVEGVGKVEWNALGPEPLQQGVSLRLLLARHAYFGEWNDFLALFLAFLKWSMRRAAKDGGLEGRSLDGIYANARLPEGVKYSTGEIPTDFALFDEEWRLDGTLPASWFVFRNVFNLVREKELFNTSAPFGSFSELYDRCCKELGVVACLTKDLEKEASLQAATRWESKERHASQLKGLMEWRFSGALMPRSPQAEAATRYASPGITLKKVPRAIARRLKRVLAKVPVLKRTLGESLKVVRWAAEFARFSLRPFSPRFLPSDTPGEQTALVPDFPRGFLLLGVPKGTVPFSLRFGMRVDGQFAEQTLRVKEPVLVIKLDAKVESLTLVSKAGAASLSVRKLSRVEAAIRLFAKFRPTFPHARAQIDLPVVDDYGAWVENFGTLTESDKAVVTQRISELSSKPLFSIVMPVYNTPEKWLCAAIDSVKAQLYPHWELCIANDASTDPRVRSVLDAYAKSDSRIRVVHRVSNGHIAEASNSALELAQGEFVGLLDHDDLLAPEALAVVAEAQCRFPQTDLFYSDEDKIDGFGRRYAPHFKPDWNPDLLCSKNYISHFGVYRTQVLREIGGFQKGTEGSQDYDLVLRFVEKSERVRHLPHVLYHWRAIPGSVALAESEKGYAHERARTAIQEHLERKGKKVTVARGFGFMHQVRYALPDPPPLVSLIIPTRDRKDLLEKVVEGIRSKTQYPSWEILVVDNQTSDPSTLDYFRSILGDSRIRVLRYDAPFNFSAMVNVAAAEAKGSILALLNNDIEVLESDWLTELVSFASQVEVGCVGAKLLYSDGRIQHAGVYLGIGGVADHLYRFAPRDSNMAQSAIQVTAGVSAVTGAALVVRKQVFDRVGGFNERDLAIAYNDVDFCLRVQASGLRNVYHPRAVLIHAESASRGSDVNPARRERFARETAFMKMRWGQVLKNDPAYNPNLSLKTPGGAVAFPPRTLPFYRIARSVKSSEKAACVPESGIGKSPGV